MAKKVRSKSRRSRTRRSGRKMRGGMFSQSDWRSQSQTFGTPSGAPAEWDRGNAFNPRNIGTGGVLMSDSPYARSLPNHVRGHRGAREAAAAAERIRREGPVDIGSDEFRQGMAETRVEASVRRECTNLPQRYRELYELVLMFTNLLNHPRVEEFYDANGDDILFPDGESINSFKARIYETGRRLPQPDVFNSCNCR